MQSIDEFVKQSSQSSSKFKSIDGFVKQDQTSPSRFKNINDFVGSAPKSPEQSRFEQNTNDTFSNMNDKTPALLESRSGTIAPKKDSLLTKVMDNPYGRGIKYELRGLGNAMDSIKELPIVHNIVGGLAGAVKPISETSQSMQSSPPKANFKGFIDHVERGAKMVGQSFQGAAAGLVHPDQAIASLEHQTAKDTPLNRFVTNAIADPFTYVGGGGTRALAEKYAGTKIGNAAEDFLQKNKVTEPQVPQQLSLPPASAETIRLQGLRDRANKTNVLPTNETPVQGKGDIHTFALPESNTPRIISDIQNQAKELIKPPTARRDLIDYVQHHLELPKAEVIKLTDKDLYEYGQMIRNNTNMDSLHQQIAVGQGHNWNDLVSGKSVTGHVDSPINVLQFNRKGNAPEQLVGEGKPVETPVIPPRKSIDDFVKGQSSEPKVVKEAVAPLREVSAQSEPIAVGTRSNFKNQLDNGNFSEELKQKINETDQTYDPISNAESIAQANKNVKNVDKAESQFLLNQKGGADHIATGYRLLQKLDALGEHERALVVSKKLAADLTKSGQTVQAAKILSKLSPEAQLLNLVRTAEKSGRDVTVTDSVKFKELAAKVQEKSGAGIRANQYNEILNRMEKGENIGVADIQKLSDYLSGAKKDINPKATKIVDDLPPELKDVRKRDKIVSFLDKAEQSALARIAARKNNLNSLPIGEWADHAIVVSSQIAKGTIRAATHVEDLVKLFGEEVRPVATQVFQKAQGMLKSVSHTSAEGSLEKASQALRRVSGEAEKEKAIVAETAKHVKKLIADAKSGKLDPADIQNLRDYSDEIADMIKDKETKIPTQDEKFLQTVKSLAKKIAQVESERIPADIANREVSSLLRQLSKLSGDGPVVASEKINNQALSDIAHDVLEKSRPTPKPTTLQEKIVEKYIKKNPVSPKDIENLRQLAKDVTRLSGDDSIHADIAMQKILNSYEKSSPWDKVQALRYMAMLFNSATQSINAISGPIMASTGHIADVFGTMVDISMNKVLKTPRTTTLYGTNPLKFMARYFKNAKVGGKAGWEGADPAGIHSTGEIRGLAYKSLKNPFGLAERSLGAVSKGADYATYKSVYQSEIAKQGLLDAKNSGIKGKANIDQHVQNFINEPSEAAMLIADRIGKNTTFQRSDSLGGKAANFLNSAPGPIKPVVSAIVPFVRTPINMASSAVTMTPAGIIKGLYQLSSKSEATQREAIRTLSLGITGSGVGAIGYYLSQLGVITGANDSGDKNVDAIREQTGKGKYRFNTSGLYRYLEATFNGEGEAAAEQAAQYQEGDKQFDYNKLQPLAFPLAIGASLGNNKDKSIVGKLRSAGSDAYGSLYGMSTLKGVQDIFQPSYGGSMGDKALGVPSRIAESFLKSFSPSFLGQEARREDPIIRKTPFNDGVIADTKGYMKSRVPGLSQSLPPNKTTLGQDKLNAPGIRGQLLNPFKSDVAPYNKAAVIISDLIDRTGDTSLAPTAPDKKVTGKDRKGNQVSIAVPQERYAQMQKVIGDEIINKIIALDPKLSDQRKADRIKEIYSDARGRERDKVKRELGIIVN